MLSYRLHWLWILISEGATESSQEIHLCVLFFLSLLPLPHSYDHDEGESVKGIDTDHSVHLAQYDPVCRNQPL